MATQSTSSATASWDARTLLTVPEVAEWARVHPKTVYRWIQDGKLEAYQFGPRTYRIPEDALAEFLRKAGYFKLVSPPKNGKGQP